MSDETENNQQHLKWYVDHKFEMVDQRAELRLEKLFHQMTKHRMELKDLIAEIRRELPTK